MSDAANQPDTDTQDESASSADETNYLAMSDEELLNLAEPGEEPAAPAQAADEGDPGDDAQAIEQDGESPADGDDTGSGAAGAEDDGTETGETPADQEKGKDKDSADDPAGAEGEKAGADADKKPDYEKLYSELLSPFRANGKEIKIDNVDDARRLMQMGANYNKKMSALKPHLKTLKLLENNGLLDEQKLSFYIDIEQKKPEAIAKLLKDSKIDPLDLDLEKDDYQASTYTVDDREIELDSVLDEIKDSPQYHQLLETVSTKWDKASQQVIGKEPRILRVIHDHMSNGVYDVIAKEMDRQKMLGHLDNLSDLEAYRQVGDAIQAQGGFNHLFEQKPNSGTAPVQREEVKPPAASEASALANKRRAARATKSTSAPPPTDGFNPLGLSDEEFEKRFDPRLM